MNRIITTESPRPRSRFWDLVRGIGILAIVMGHSCPFVIQYVYAFHLAVFFFVSGYLYQEGKYGLRPFDHFAAKLRSAWPRYVFYMWVFILCHNLFLRIGIDSSGVVYGRSNMLVFLCNTVVFQGAEFMGGAMWFVPVWVLACGIFGGSVWFALRFLPDRQWMGRPLYQLGEAALSLLFGLTGCMMIFRQLYLSYQLHLAFLVQPFFAAGWLLRCQLPCLKRWLKWYGALGCGVLFVFLLKHYQLYVDVTMGRIGDGWQYYLVALLGIYCCMYLASVLEKIKGLSGVVSLWGRYSFDIMALHFFIFKMVDVIYGRFLLGEPAESYSSFPQAYSAQLWPLYAFLGVMLPAAIGLALEQGGKKLAAYLPKDQS